MQTKDTSQIPKGIYCYTWEEFPSKENNFRGKTKVCPYYKSKDIAGIKVPWCEFLESGGTNNGWTEEDWDKVKEYYEMQNKDMDKELPLFFLWDGCKECGENLD